MLDRDLKLFIDLARSLHFGDTARENHLSTSTLSRRIQRLEAKVGQALLLRDNRSVRLTRAGEKFLDFALARQRDWERLQAEIMPLKAGLSGILRMYCSVTAAYSHLPPLLDRFRAAHPGVEIALTTGDPADAIAHLQARRVDVSIAALPERLPESLRFLPLDEVPLRIIAPRADFGDGGRAGRQAPRWQDLSCIFPEHGPARDRFIRWLQGRGVRQPRIYARVSGHEALVSMVALGLGIGIAPQVVIDNSPVKSRLTSLSTATEIEPFTLGLCSLGQSAGDPRVEAFLRVAAAGRQGSASG